jgi:glycosyltransferase involved in cell wall biosynthesis
MRPALDGYSGIPQETRLLFRGLAAEPEFEIVGLLQSGNLILESGLPLDRQGNVDARLSASERIDRLSQVVVSLQQGPASHRFEHWRKVLLALTGPAKAALSSLVGSKTPLTAFDPHHFEDYVWRAMFAKSLPFEDFALVTQRHHRVLRWPWSIMHAIGVASGSLGHALYPRLDTRGIDVLIGETPYPGRPGPGTRMVVRYHDAIPLLMPHTIKDRGYHRAMHFHALKRNAADGAWFACVSNATRDDLLSVMPELENRTATIPNMISHHFHPEEGPSTRIPEIIWSRKNRSTPHSGGAAVNPADLVEGRLPYLLMVSTLEPRKNHLALLDAWELLRAGDHPHLNLVFVGGLGWEHESILKRLTPWLERGGLHLLSDVPADDLRLLYRHADATVCPSLNEGFDFSGVEAMASGGLVAASDLPVHREVFGDASEYFSPYDPADLAAAVGRVIAPSAEARRHSLRDAGRQISAQYQPSEVIPRWRDFLDRVASTSSA